MDVRHHADAAARCKFLIAQFLYLCDGGAVHHIGEDLRPIVFSLNLNHIVPLCWFRRAKPCRIIACHGTGSPHTCLNNSNRVEKRSSEPGTAAGRDSSFHSRPCPCAACCSPRMPPVRADFRVHGPAQPPMGPGLRQTPFPSIIKQNCAYRNPKYRTFHRKTPCFSPQAVLY